MTVRSDRTLGRRVRASGAGTASLRPASALAVVLGAAMAWLGMVWTPLAEVAAPIELYDTGLYRRDTPFVAGGAQGSDLLTLLAVAPAMLWSLAGPLDRMRTLVLAAGHTWLLYLAASLSLGAVAFNEAFPLYVALMPVSLAGLTLSLARLPYLPTPRWLPAFLVGCGIVTGLVWALLLFFEMAGGEYPPASYYTSRTTYALDLGLIAPGCIAAGLGLHRGRRRAQWLAVPLLCFAGLLLPMMALQTLMQLRAGVSFGPEAVAPFAGFGLVSGGAAWFLWRLATTEQAERARR